MAKQIINIGSQANDRSGDPLRTAFNKINQNFTELYTTASLDIQIPVQTGNVGKYLTTNGSVLSWSTVSGGAGGGLSITDFGEGFVDNLDAGKITTSKLYNENPNQGLNNQYTLEVTDGGVVALPDGSIINGATLKTIAGNYAGITAGPASPAGRDEDSWVWVDNDGATIATKYSTDNYQWKFDNNGVFTLPNGGQIANYPDGVGASNNSWFVTPGGEDGNGGVSSQDGQQYIQINNNLSVEIGTSYGTENESIWRFGRDGDLTLPEGGDILDSNGDSVLGGGSYTPDDSDNWNEPTINTISAALDELAARITALQNYEIDGGNANTPELGELLIDGNGA